MEVVAVAMVGGWCGGCGGGDGGVVVAVGVVGVVVGGGGKVMLKCQ